jgi:hypothetical protein
LIPKLKTNELMLARRISQRVCAGQRLNGIVIKMA